jgi:hypothetical protein
MVFRIDLAVGSVRAAQLINSYRTRLKEADLLDDDAALRVACSAYADGNIYVVAAPGQIWTSTKKKFGKNSRQIQVAALSFTAHGHFARCADEYGMLLDIPLDVMAEDFTLTRWPAEQIPSSLNHTDPAGEEDRWF